MHWNVPPDALPGSATFVLCMYCNTDFNEIMCAHNIIYVTGFGKTLRMGFFQKIEFDAWLISSTIELTRVQVLGRSRASLWRYSALFVIAPHPQ